MVRRCVAGGCSNTELDPKDIRKRFHNFPLAKSRSQMFSYWMKIINPKRFPVFNRDCVCSNHFSADCYSELFRLRSYAFPNRHLRRHRDDDQASSQFTRPVHQITIQHLHDALRRDTRERSQSSGIIIDISENPLSPKIRFDVSKRSLDTSSYEVNEAAENPHGSSYGLDDRRNPHGSSYGLDDPGNPHGSSYGLHVPGNPHGYSSYGLDDQGNPHGYSSYGLDVPGNPHGFGYGLDDQGNPHGSSYGLDVPGNPHGFGYGLGYATENPHSSSYGLDDRGNLRGSSYGLEHAAENPHSSSYGLDDPGNPRGSSYGLDDPWNVHGFGFELDATENPHSSSYGLDDRGNPHGSSYEFDDRGNPHSFSHGLHFTGNPHSSSYGLDDTGNPHRYSYGLDDTENPHSFSIGLDASGNPHSSSYGRDTGGSSHSSSLGHNSSRFMHISNIGLDASAHCSGIEFDPRESLHSSISELDASGSLHSSGTGLDPENSSFSLCLKDLAGRSPRESSVRVDSGIRPDTSTTGFHTSGISHSSITEPQVPVIQRHSGPGFDTTGASHSSGIGFYTEQSPRRPTSSKRQQKILPKLNIAPNKNVQSVHQKRKVNVHVLKFIWRNCIRNIHCHFS